MKKIDDREINRKVIFFLSGQNFDFNFNSEIFSSLPFYNDR